MYENKNDLVWIKEYCMLEMLLILTILTGNQESFNKSSEAYFKYQKIDVVVEKIGKENPMLAHTVGAIGLARNRKLYYKIEGNFFQESSIVDGDFRNIAWWKREF